MAVTKPKMLCVQTPVFNVKRLFCKKDRLAAKLAANATSTIATYRNY